MTLNGHSREAGIDNQGKPVPRVRLAIANGFARGRRNGAAKQHGWIDQDQRYSIQ